MANEDLQVDEIDFDNESMQAQPPTFLHPLAIDLQLSRDEVHAESPYALFRFLEYEICPAASVRPAALRHQRLALSGMVGVSVPSARKLLRRTSGDAHTALLAQSTALL